MKKHHIAIGVFLVFALLGSQTVCAEIKLETTNLRLVIGSDGCVKSLTGKTAAGEEELLRHPGQESPAAVVYCGGKSFPSGTWQVCTEADAPVYKGGQAASATSASLDGRILTLGFGATNTTTVKYEVTLKPDYITLKLISLKGEPIDRIDLLLLDIKRPAYLGPWINVAYDDHFGVCLCGGNIETNAGMNRHADHVIMRAIADKAVALQDATAVLFGFERDPSKKDQDPTRKFLAPTGRFLDVMENVEHDFNMPSGAKNRRLPIQRYSYFWGHPWTGQPVPDNIDEYLSYAKQGGYRIFMLSYFSFTDAPGHYLFNKRYQRGVEDLKFVTDKIRAAGMKVGLHIHYNKAGLKDPYVTPVPDQRLHKLRHFTLAAGVDDKADTIEVNENPKGCPMADGTRILQIGDELLTYKEFTNVKPFLFSGCSRGHLKTVARSHAAGSRASLLDMDGPRWIRYDQNTDIQDESSKCLAEIFRKTGPYEFVYFDGTEDVHAPFWYNITNSQYRTYRLLKPEPQACEAAINTHFSWHMNTRSNAYDVWPDAKNFVRQMPMRSAPVRLFDFTRLQFGWSTFIAPDALEYLFSRAAAWDCPASITATLGNISRNPRREDCLDVMKTWEDARLAGKLTDKQLNMLRTLDPVHYRFMCCGVQGKAKDVEFVGQGLNEAQLKKLLDLGQEHHLLINEKGTYELAAVDEIPDAGGGAVKAYSLKRETSGSDSYVMAWSRGTTVKLLLPVDPNRLIVMRPFGQRLDVEIINGKPAVNIDNRRYLCFKGMTSAEAERIIRNAKLPTSAANK